MMLMKKKNEKGFTLIELVIVVAVLAIIAAVAIPTVGNIVTSARTSADDANEALFESIIEMYKVANDAYPSLEQARTAIKGGTKFDTIPSAETTGNDFYYDDSTGDVQYASAAPSDDYEKLTE